MRLPQSSDAEKARRAEALKEATRHAIDVPFHVMETARDVFDVVEAMVENGMSSSVSDAGVGALCARAAVRGAYLNVRINAAGLDDPEFVKDRLERGSAIEDQVEKRERAVLEAAHRRMSDDG